MEGFHPFAEFDYLWWWFFFFIKKILCFHLLVVSVDYHNLSKVRSPIMVLAPICTVLILVKVGLLTGSERLNCCLWNRAVLSIFKRNLKQIMVIFFWSLLCNFDSFCLLGHPYHTAGLTCLAISSDSTLAVTGCEDGSIHVVNIVTGKVWCAFVTFNTTGRVSLVSCLVPWLVSHLKLSGL